MHEQRHPRHGQKGDQIDRLRLLLREPQKKRQNGNQQRAAAHPHTAERSADDAG